MPLRHHLTTEKGVHRETMDFTRVFMTAVTVTTSGCLTHNIQPQLEEMTGNSPLQPEEQPAPLVTGVALPELFGATQEGFDAAIGADEGHDGTNHCPSVRDPAMPPCTFTAGKSGAYARAAWRCVIGLGELWEWHYPSLRTCMDAYMPHQVGRVVDGYSVSVDAALFYATDLFKYWRVDTAQMNMWWAFVDLYSGWWTESAVLSHVINELTCPFLVAASTLTGPVTVALAGIGCGVAKAIVLDAGGV